LKKYLNKITNADCLDVMKELPDNAVDLVLTDPPYGIGESGARNKADRPTAKWKNPNSQEYKPFDDSKIPAKEIFNEMFRVSKNQIIWGGNHFVEHLKPSSGWLIWDKQVDPKECLSMCELAYTSYKKRAMKFEYLWAGFKKKVQEERFHPTQKPKELMVWCLQYAGLEKNSTVLDCFSGSASTALACHDLGYNFICIEKDPDYHKASIERLEEHQRQQRLF